MVDIKNEFRIDALHSIFSFIKMIDNSRCGEDTRQLMEVIEYASLLEFTKVTPDLFKGETAIFDGFETWKTKGYGIRYVSENYIINQRRFKNKEAVLYLSKVIVKDEFKGLYDDISSFKNLHELAQLTTENPIKLK